DAGLGLDAAVDVAAVQHRAHEALPAGLGSLGGCVHGAHRGAGTLPVGSGGAGASIAPIGSADGATAGGRPGSRSRLSNCVGRIGLSARWRSARPWMRPGVSSLAHSARKAAMASRSRRNSPASLPTRSACKVESNLIL